MRDDALEAALVDLGRVLAYPRPTLAQAVRARLSAAPAPRRSWWTRPLVPALATAALLLLVVAVASPQVRAAAREILRIGGIDIFPVPTVAPTPTASPLIPGTRMTLDAARAAVHFAIRVPEAPELGAPDQVLVDGGTVERVTLLYGARPGIPPSRVPGVSALVVEIRGDVESNLFGKAVGPDTTLQPVAVNGAPGFWLEGAPHLFFYRDAAGAIRDETLRLAGNTLIWVDSGVTYRLEAQISRADALRIAASLR